MVRSENFPHFKPGEEIRYWDTQSVKPEMIELAMNNRGHGFLLL
jgi:hypothetical protein